MLYNEGEGEMIFIDEIIATRHKERTGGTENYTQQSEALLIQM